MTKILVLSDLHVGSLYALSPKPETPEQRYILKEWLEMCARVRPEYLIINGDIIEGTQRAEEGKSLQLSDVDKQIDAAVELVNRINYGKLLVTYGTRYHTDENLNGDQVFAKVIGANAHNYELSFKPAGVDSILHFSHHVSVSFSSWQYRTTPIAKELVAALLNEKELYKYDGIIRSHAHYFVQVSFSAFGIITPCWQGRTPYMISKGLSLIPKLGYVILESEEGKWRVRANTFNIKRPELVVI